MSHSEAMNKPLGCSDCDSRSTCLSHGCINDPSFHKAAARFADPDFDDSDFLKQEGALHAVARVVVACRWAGAVLAGCGLLMWLYAAGVIDLRGIL